jgi:hypothetical protein
MARKQIPLPGKRYPCRLNSPGRKCAQSSTQLTGHLGLQVNEVAGAPPDALDLEALGQTRAPGGLIDIDPFGPAWNFCDWSTNNLDGLCRQQLLDLSCST